MTTFVETKATRDAISVLNSDTGETFDFKVIGDAHGRFSLEPVVAGVPEDADDPAHAEDAEAAIAFASAILAKMAP